MRFHLEDSPVSNEVTIRKDVSIMVQWEWGIQCLKQVGDAAAKLLKMPVYFGRHAERLPGPALVLFPSSPNMLACGLAGIVSVKRPDLRVDAVSDFKKLADLMEKVAGANPPSGAPGSVRNSDCLGGSDTVEELLTTARRLKEPDSFYAIFTRKDLQSDLEKMIRRLSDLVAGAEKNLKGLLGRTASKDLACMSTLIDALKDAHWCLGTELSDNLDKVRHLVGFVKDTPSIALVSFYREINAVLNSIDRLEVRGRDSAGVSVMLLFEEEEFRKAETAMAKQPAADGTTLEQTFEARRKGQILLNGCIGVRCSKEDAHPGKVAVTLTYKVAAEIGSLGDNVRFLRKEIQEDEVLRLLAAFGHSFHTISTHTRWASVGAINEGNCHPVDNRAEGTAETAPIIHACLNGDIDNYLILRESLVQEGIRIPEEITTDTKIIPLQIEKYIRSGDDVLTAFRHAVNDFDGSHAISMHTDLAPGKLFLAQRGSGQAIFVGLSESHYMPTSEVYGFVEETSRYLKLDGEKVVAGADGPTQGQIFVLDQASEGGLDGIRALYYDGTPITFDEEDIHYTNLTSRDIDRQGYPHYFLKEISESPLSVERTLQNRWRIESDGEKRYRTDLDETMVPEGLKQALQAGEGCIPIRRIFFIGQGTAGVAAQACASIMNYYLNDPLLNITPLKASELSGFELGEELDSKSMADVLVVAISQSGTTTDTNRAVDMVKAHGAHTLAIVNRRDSDLTFKADGVLYTSTGRDIEMSVASTKAFYSQIVAGALLGLCFAELKGRRSAEFIARELANLLEIPRQMRKVLTLKEDIEDSAKRLAPVRTYWAAVGSGPNKAASDEIRIKLSELCYKTISSDYIEDKKHIDLSSEPLIIVCAAGARENVLGDIIKDTAIFKAHKAAPVVIANEGEERFTPYAESVFHVPAAPQHLSPILNTLVGHLWGYYAALAINEGSKFLHDFRTGIRDAIDARAEEGLDIFEMVLEKSFRETIVSFYNQFRTRRNEQKVPTPIVLASDLILLLKYLSGRLPAADFELDFNQKGTARNMLDTLFKFMGESINAMARPVDAIKHQAKTVTVGTSRISEKVEGILFDALKEFGIGIPQITNSNIVVMKNLQGIVDRINGAIFYTIDGMNLLGEPTDDTTIQIVRKTGVLEPIPSRVETDFSLKGTKRIIVRQGNVYIGKGRKDDRSILVIPVISASPEKPNIIENLLLLNIGFKTDATLAVKTKALGGKYEHIKNIVQENSIPWEDSYLDRVPMEDLFGLSAEKVGEMIQDRL